MRPPAVTDPAQPLFVLCAGTISAIRRPVGSVPRLPAGSGRAAFLVDVSPREISPAAAVPTGGVGARAERVPDGGMYGPRRPAIGQGRAVWRPARGRPRGVTKRGVVCWRRCDRSYTVVRVESDRFHPSLGGWESHRRVCYRSRRRLGEPPCCPGWRIRAAFEGQPRSHVEGQPVVREVARRMSLRAVSPSRHVHRSHVARRTGAGCVASPIRTEPPPPALSCLRGLVLSLVDGVGISRVLTVRKVLAVHFLGRCSILLRGGRSSRPTWHGRPTCRLPCSMSEGTCRRSGDRWWGRGVAVA